MTVNIALFDDLDAVGEDAAGALDRAAQPSLFARLAWFRLLAEHCPPPGRLAVLRGRDGGRQAWLFLAVTSRRARAYAAWYSLRFDGLGDLEGDVMTSIAEAVRKSGIDEVELAPIADPEPLRKAFRGAGWTVFVTPKTGNWRVEIGDDDFAAYWEKRPARLRNTAKRRARSAALDIEIYERFDARAWADYEAVYRASWKPEEGSFPFLRALAEQEGEAGTLRLGVARKSGRPVAVQLWLVENGEAMIHKLAYTEEAKAMSPGTILGEAMFRHAIDKDRVRAIDYGTGDDGYKKDWMEERRVLWQLAAYNPGTLRGLLGIARARASALVARVRSR
ncbi:MAG TPA: GNAT family N-acetyltransferase [Allosphingosinicella sp.]|nr:GNAT family N-acetyltransferase [Allosphingosinicella sp.]